MNLQTPPLPPHPQRPRSPRSHRLGLRGPRSTQPGLGPEEPRAHRRHAGAESRGGPGPGPLCTHMCSRQGPGLQPPPLWPGTPDPLPLAPAPPWSVPGSGSLICPSWEGSVQARPECAAGGHGHVHVSRSSLGLTASRGRLQGPAVEMGTHPAAAPSLGEGWHGPGSAPVAHQVGTGHRGGPWGGALSRPKACGPGCSQLPWELVPTG